MSIRIRKATSEDMFSIYALVQELAAYEKGLDKVTTTPETYLKDHTDGFFEALVAEKESLIVGIAIYFSVFSTWRGRMLYLEDFVVKETERGEGIGKLLFDAFIEEAKRIGVALVKWQVLKWNEPAIHFYNKYDVDFDDEWIDGKIYLMY